MVSQYQRGGVMSSVFYIQKDTRYKILRYYEYVFCFSFIVIFCLVSEISVSYNIYQDLPHLLVHDMAQELGDDHGDQRRHEPRIDVMAPALH